MRIVTVDENDNIVGSIEREERKPEHIYRVSALWLQNSKGDVLLAQRSAKKKDQPTVWGPAVAGTVEEGETYLENILKEAREEIGLDIKNDLLVLGPKIRHRLPTRNYFTQFYIYVCDKPAESFLLAEDEVGAVRWSTRRDLQNEFRAHPENFVASASQWLPGLISSTQ